MHKTLRAGLAALAVGLLPVANAVAAAYGTRTLRVGSSGSDVKSLQRYLDRAGYDTSADGAYGPATARSVRGFESAEGLRANGVASRSDQRLVRQRAQDRAAAPPQPAAQPVPAPTEKAYLDPSGLAVAPASAPPQVQAIIAAGNAIATKPYVYGGGHGRWRDSGYDCSGSVSYVLHAAGLLDTALDSTGLMSWGEPGRGQWITVRSNPGHAYLIVAGLRFDTSARRETGSRWTATMRSARGYRGRHPEGL